MTQYYVGTKLIMAWEAEEPMPNDPDFRARVSTGEQPWSPRPGYAVKYPDGYQSWSPKETFEEAYLGIGNSEIKGAVMVELIRDYTVGLVGDIDDEGNMADPVPPVKSESIGDGPQLPEAKLVSVQ